jgi:hypothetical protein
MDSRDARAVATARPVDADELIHVIAALTRR